MSFVDVFLGYVVGAEGIELLAKSFHQVLLSLQALGEEPFRVVGS